MFKTPAATLQDTLGEKTQPMFDHWVSVLRREAFISGFKDLPTNFVLIPATIHLARQGGQFPGDAVWRRLIHWIFWPACGRGIRVPRTPSVSRMWRW